MYVNQAGLIALGLLAPMVMGGPIAQFNDFFDSIGDAVGDVVDNVQDAVGGVVDGVVDGVTEFVEDIPDFVEGITDEVVEFAGDLLPQAPGTPLDPALLPDLLYFAEYASATYCDPNVVGTEVVCPDNFCPTVSSNTVTTIAEFQDQGSADTSGIVALDDTTQNIVVAFRGSQSIRNFFTNARLTLTDVPEFCAGCKAHTGFLDAFNEEFPGALAAVTQLRQENPTFGLVVTGHSLGGAIATIAATELRRLGFECTLFSYGAPRIGNKELSEFISNDGVNFRVTHLDDPVPRLPPLILGYEHISPELHITQGDINIRPEDINVLPGGINFLGNTGVNAIGFNVSAHRQYLLDIEFSGCGELGDGGIEFRI